ncbi:Transcription factor rfx3 [Balamuthia mandrillaris]
MMDMVGEGMSHLNLDADEREEAATSSNMTKISKKEALPRVIDWIKHNYEESDSSCLPKHLVYQHYQEFCIASHLQCTNMANFGKIIRSVFPQLKTRRLGPRGKTKHHYHGIRLSPVSTLEMPSQVQTGRRVAQRSSKSSSSSSGQKGGGGDGNSSNLPSSPRSMTTHSTRNRSSSDTSLTPMNDSSGGSGAASPLKRRRRTHGRLHSSFFVF